MALCYIASRRSVTSYGYDHPTRIGPYMPTPMLIMLILIWPHLLQSVVLRCFTGAQLCMALRPKVRSGARELAGNLARLPARVVERVRADLAKRGLSRVFAVSAERSPALFRFLNASFLCRVLCTGQLILRSVFSFTSSDYRLRLLLFLLCRQRWLSSALPLMMTHVERTFGRGQVDGASSMLALRTQ